MVQKVLKYTFPVVVVLNKLPHNTMYCTGVLTDKMSRRQTVRDRDIQSQGQTESEMSLTETVVDDLLPFEMVEGCFHAVLVGGGDDGGGCVGDRQSETETFRVRDRQSQR